MKILLVDNGLEFDLNTPYIKPLGGSEISLILLAKGLANLNHQIVLLNNCNHKDQSNNIIQDHISLFDQYANISDVILLNRYIPPSIMNFLTKKIYYWCHDAFDQNNIKWMMNKNATKLLTNILCVSEWQKQTFLNYFNIPDNLLVLGNPIDYSLYQGYTERNLNKLVFTSIPYKGLDVLPDLFNEIKIKSKNENLHLDIYSSFDLYQSENEDFNNVFRQLSNIKDVNLFDLLSMKDLAYVFKSANLSINPNTYMESFGRVYIEAMASGCIPVCMNNGANKEIVEDGEIIPYANINNIEAFNYFVNKVVELLDEDLYNKRIKMEREMMKWDYNLIAKRFEDILWEF
jgi:glycosyltransferase involved in cell wall biosynthesis